MAGLLDFMQSPAGIGLLSAVAGGMSGARRGTPWNNAGRGLVSGLTGYTAAQDQLKQDAENKLTQQLKQLQMDELTQKINNQKALRAAATGAAQDATKPTQYSVGGQTFGAPEQAISSAQNMFSLPSGALPDSIGQGSPLVSFDQQAPAPSLVDVSGGQVPQITRQDTPNMRGAMYTRLMQAGFPEEAAKYAPEWMVGERFNTETGMPEKVLYDKNNPTNAVPFGGTQADTIVADNLGGQMVYRGSHSANPISTVARTLTPEAILTDNRTRSEGALNRGVTIRGQTLTDKRARELNAINAGARGDKITEGERKAATLLNRLTFSQQQLKDALKQNPDAAKPGLAASGLRSMGMETAANALATGSERQRVESAQLDMLDAALTLGTGAAYTREQLEGYRRSYFPQIGDSPAQVADKAARLNNVVEAAKIAAGRAAPATPAVPAKAGGGVTFLGFE